MVPDPPRPAAQGGRPGARGRRRELCDPPRRDAFAGRRIRLRQDHHLALHPARADADRGRDPLPHRGRPAGRRRSPAQGRAAAAAPPDADDLPGPVLVAEPAHDDHRHHRRAAARERRARPRGAPAPGARAARPRASARGLHEPLPARVLGRAAAAHRHRPRAGAQSRRWSSPTSRSRRSTSRSRRRS